MTRETLADKRIEPASRIADIRQQHERKHYSGKKREAAGLNAMAIEKFKRKTKDMYTSISR
ncbi:MAG: hypothetical protein FWG03_01145 [Clostridiales bacterium]|nr:hypothetical protein [Clostridiales bacterium]